MNYTIKQIAEITQSQVIGNPDLLVKNIAFDSRNIYSTQNTAFLALTTEKNSGQKYIASAIEKGIEIIITERPPTIEDHITYIVTKNGLDFIQKLAKHHLNQFPDLQTIGITGSNGKTVVKEWLYQSLNEDFSVVKSPKSFNSQLGLPLSLLQTTDKNEIGIFEVGISKPDEMQKLESIFSPKIGILTHIGTAHLSNFENENQLVDEKLMLFENTDLIFYNGDLQLVREKIKEKYSDRTTISYGIKKGNDVHIANDWKDRKQNIQVQYFGELLEFPVQQRDEATLTNALSIICLLKHFNFSNDKIIQKINQLKSIEMRLESVVGLRNNLIINDSFNLDFDSLVIAYQFIKEYTKKEKVLILTDFIDQRQSAELYKEVAALTNEQNFTKVLLIGEEIAKFESLFNAETYTFNTTNQLLDSQIIHSISDSLILLKGARKFEIEKVKLSLELQKHDTVLEINLNSILHNINVHKSLLKPETKMMAMVKAFSYGLGSYEIAEFLQHHHIDYLTVAYADEGVDLRKNGITTPIMVMNPEQHSYSTIIDFNLEPEIYSFRVLDLFVEQLRQKGITNRYPIHIKLETGMHRLGFKDFELDELIEKLNMNPVKVVSIFSHLSTADVPEETTYAMHQITTFDKNSTKLIDGLGYKPLRHILNSPGIANFTEYQFDMVRIGIGMVGISQNAEVQKKLQSAVSFKTVVSQISEIHAGESVGYSRRFKADHTTRIATIPVGYADGIPRLIGNGIGKVSIKNQLVPIVGNICMDMLMLNIEDLPIKEGDEVILFNSNPSLQDFANYCQTIPYEVLTSISRRVKRIYIKN